MTDDEIADFEINNMEHRERLYGELKKKFDEFGSLTKVSIIDALEFMCLEEDLEQYWRYVVPHSIPLDDVLDKRGYLRNLFVRLAGREPMLSGKIPTEVKLKDQYSPNLNVKD